MIVIKDTDVLKEVLCGFDPVIADIVSFIVDKYEMATITSGYREGILELKMKHYLE